MPFTRNDRKAALIIAGLLLLLNLGLWLFRDSGQPASPVSDKDSVVITNGQRSMVNGQRSMVKSQFPFDPNTADSATFVALGLAPRVAKAIIHYRAAGGVFRTPDDLARIYTLPDSDFRRLRPYIKIRTSGNHRNPNAQWSTFNALRNGQSAPRNQNGFGAQSANGQRSMLNAQRSMFNTQRFPIVLSSADTTELKRIPGIGSYYSAKIVRYRERLGGFVSLSQLSEIHGLPGGLERWLVLGDSTVRRLPVNSATFGQLLRHPYLNFEQVSAIMNYRKSYGPLRDLTDLATYSAFSDTDFARLRPYIAFK